MKKNDVIKYLRDLFNFTVDNELTMNDIMQEISNLNDFNSFIQFSKERLKYSKYEYLNGYQKFVSIANDYRKENKPKLNADEDYKVRLYSEKLYSRVNYVFEEIDYRTKIGMDINDKRINMFLYNEFGEDQKALEVLNKIGNRSEILNKLRSDRNGLLDHIKRIVYSLSLKSKYPQIENKDKNTHNRTETMLKHLVNKNEY